MTPAQLIALMPFAASLGIELDAATKTEVVGRLSHDASRTTAGGALHGGALMALADSVGAVCAYLNLPPDATTSTTSSSTVFLRGVRSGTVTATARSLHVGRSSIAVSTELRDDAGRLVAQTTQSQAVLARDLSASR
ncbi:MAG TPA: PaaI family thioesterase [Jatrophihabitans sp.]|nr:PaaI family thioesterase [Jatrophihabitans sp.]